MPIEPGDSVTNEYVGRFEDGSVFDTSRYEVAAEHDLLDSKGEDPSEYPALAFTVGAGEVIEGLDDAFVGMNEGETDTVTIPPEAAYGEVEDERIREYDPETFEGMVGQAPEVGMHVHAENGLHGDVVAVREDAVEVDFNHELAGKTLVFEVEIVEIE